jgi:hypothetical protein
VDIEHIYKYLSYCTLCTVTQILVYNVEISTKELLFSHFCVILSALQKISQKRRVYIPLISGVHPEAIAGFHY